MNWLQKIQEEWDNKTIEAIYLTDKERQNLHARDEAIIQAIREKVQEQKDSLLTPEGADYVGALELDKVLELLDNK